MDVAQGVKGVAARSALGAIPLCSRVRFTAAAAPSDAAAAGSTAAGASESHAGGAVGVEQVVQHEAERGQGAAAHTHKLRLRDKVWLFAGLGSRGLIHHSILAHSLAQAIIHADQTRIPAPARRLDPLEPIHLQI